MGLPVLRLPSSSTHAVTNTPAEPQTAFRSHSPVTTAFPVLTPGRLPHHRFRGLLSVQSNYGLHGRQVPYRTLYTRGFSRFVTSTTAPVATGRSESCRAGFAPAERQRLSTAHVKGRLTRGNHRLQSSGYLCPPRARSSVCRQIASGKTSRLSHVRPEMQSWGAQPRSNTENFTGPPAPGSAFRKGLHQPSAESPALPPGVYRGSRRR
jgi:hypothetical protein